MDDEDYSLSSSSTYTGTMTTEDQDEQDLPYLLDDLSENDISDIIVDIYDQFIDFSKNNVLMMSSPTFYKTMFETIGQVIYCEWIDADLYGDISEEDEEELFEELVDFVEQVWEVYSDFCVIPMRSISYENLHSIRDEKININVDDITNKIHLLKNLPQPAQRTPAWYEFRNNLISASSLSKVFGSDSQVNSLIYEKCCPIDPNSVDFSRTNLESAAHWGVKYEPVTVMIYEDLFHTSVGEFGCIQHQKYGFIGASPDGINIDPKSTRYGRMLEIKNIYNRDITGIPKEEYWVQTQMQMEVCDLEYCDFMETRIKEYSSESDYYTDLSSGKYEYKGIVLHFIETNSKSSTVNQPHYKYVPLHLSRTEQSVGFTGTPHPAGASCEQSSLTKGAVKPRSSLDVVHADDLRSVKSTDDDWIQKTRDTCKVNGLVLFRTLYWYLDEYSCVLVPRNRFWFEAALPKIKSVWDTIVKERTDGYEHRAPKKKALKNTIVTADTSGNTYQIENLNFNKSICLVKLD